MSGFITVDIESTKITMNPFLMMGPYSVRWIQISQLPDYPWIRDLEHLKRINKYRKRHGQFQLIFNDDEIAELALLTR